MKTGILLGGHGSTLTFNKAVLEMQADRLRQAGFSDVYLGFNETSFPLISDAAEEMVQDGFERIIVLPFFIASGLHVTRDIPQKHLGLPEGVTHGKSVIAGKEVEIIMEAPFAEDPLLTDLLRERIEELRTPGKETAIIVMGHGSQLRFNREVVHLNADRLRSMDYSRVYVGFNEFDEPKIEDVIPLMIDEGAEEIVALPLFISLGKHLTTDVPAKIGIADFSDGGIVNRGGRDVEVMYATPVGADPRLVDVLVGKLRRLGLR